MAYIMTFSRFLQRAQYKLYETEKVISHTSMETIRNVFGINNNQFSKLTIKLSNFVVPN